VSDLFRFAIRVAAVMAIAGLVGVAAGWTHTTRTGDA